jgi:hypothetical protein
MRLRARARMEAHVLRTTLLTDLLFALHIPLSQRSLHNAPIFRLLLKVAVNGTHQCDFLNFCGDFGLQCDDRRPKQLVRAALRCLPYTTRTHVAWPSGRSTLTRESSMVAAPRRFQTRPASDRASHGSCAPMIVSGMLKMTCTKSNAYCQC